MNVHIKEVEEIITKNPHRKMNDIFSKIRSQVVLRALSCIQLANKITSNTVSYLIRTESRHNNYMNSIRQ